MADPETETDKPAFFPNLDGKMRYMAQLEFLAGHDVQQAVKNIRRIFGFYSIDSTLISAWFKVLEKASIKKLDGSAEYQSAIIDLFPNNSDKNFCLSLLSQVDCNARYPRLATNDGRLGYFIDGDGFNVVDLFHGQRGSVPIHDFGTRSRIEMIDDKYFLIKDELKLGFFKFDLDGFTLVKLDSAELGEDMHYGNIYLDQLDKRRFIVFHYETSGKFQTGRIDGDKIVLVEVANLGIEEMHYCKLVGEEFSGFFVKEELCNFEFNLETRKYTISKFTNGGFYFSFRAVYTWHNNRLYVTILNHYGDECTIAVIDFDNNTQKMTDIEISSRVHSMFVDDDGFLTVIAEGVNATFYTYRFPLRSPDSLQNLAWLACSKQCKLFDMEDYVKLLGLLPDTSHLRLKFPKEAHHGLVQLDKESASNEPGVSDEQDGLDQEEIAVPEKRLCVDSSVSRSVDNAE